MAVQIMHNEIYKICQDALSTPYAYGTNDCNVVALRIVDLVASTEWVKECKYKTLKGGMAKLQKLGYESTLDIIKQYADVVTAPIDGDIWTDPDNPHVLAIVISNRLLGVDEEHKNFKLIPSRKDGIFYRVRKQNG